MFLFESDTGLRLFKNYCDIVAAKPTNLYPSKYQKHPTNKKPINQVVSNIFLHLYLQYVERKLRIATLEGVYISDFVAYIY
jgi:hypothetical protein